jgi:hypothetical protein
MADILPSRPVADGVICLSPDQLRALLEDAGEAGAKRTLARLGLDDEKAVHDMREVRDLLSAWRSARRVAWETVVRAGTIGLLAALAAGLALNWLGTTRQ